LGEIGFEFNGRRQNQKNKKKKNKKKFEKNLKKTPNLLTIFIR
jgi:hypothetical protein